MDNLASPPLSWHLESPGPAGEILRTVLRPLPFAVGRGSGCDLVLSSRHASQRHAEFFLRGATLWLRDLRSTNGTWINNERVRFESLVASGDVLRFADREFRLRSEAVAPMVQQTQVFTRSDRMRLEKIVREPLAFRNMLRDNALCPHFQPLVRFADGQIFGYEALGRGELDGRLTAPDDLFFIAEKLGLEVDLSAALRAQGAGLAERLPGDRAIFLNTHPAEIADPGLLLRSLELLRKRHPSLPLVLEVHEAAVADVSAFRELRFGLDGLDVALAFDDFGRGRSRLRELDEIAPNYVKFDADLIEKIHLPVHRRRHELVRNLVRLSREMAVVPIAECIETAEEAAACKDLGFELGQGYFLGTPAPAPAA